MEVYTIGFTKKKAAEFFGTLRRVGIKRLLDVRLNNSSQLSGFSKQDDLAFFLKELCAAEYVHEPLLAPTPELLKSYRQKKIKWAEYEAEFLKLMESRQVEQKVDAGQFAVPIVLLCSEPKADRCHRRLVVDYLSKKWGGIAVTHL
jgi:uncharacterized protein (DUF488 family)